MSSATERTRRFLTDWFARLESSGFDGGVFLGALSDDLVWTATGASPVSGTFRGKQSASTTSGVRSTTTSRGGPAWRSCGSSPTASGPSSINELFADRP
jgi:ketosteroid isomerase-like protein